MYHSKPRRIKRIRPKFWFWAYNNGSGSANQLIERLNGRLIKHERSKYRQKFADIVINWGSSTAPAHARIGINSPDNVAVAVSKQRTFDKLRASGVTVPDSTRSFEVAREWNKNFRILGRDADHGRAGNGITVYDKKSPEIKHHQFYVKYWRKQREFRIHVFNGRVIFEQEKLQKDGARESDGYSKYIRSHERGWVFAFKHLHDNPTPPAVRDMAVAAVRALGLSFGACDMGWNEKDGPCVFEVNTAPGIEESCLDAYVAAFQTLNHGF